MSLLSSLSHDVLLLVGKHLSVPDLVDWGCVSTWSQTELNNEAYWITKYELLQSESGHDYAPSLSAEERRRPACLRFFELLFDTEYATEFTSNEAFAIHPPTLSSKALGMMSFRADADLIEGPPFVHIHVQTEVPFGPGGTHSWCLRIEKLDPEMQRLTVGVEGVDQEDDSYFGCTIGSNGYTYGAGGNRGRAFPSRGAPLVLQAGDVVHVEVNLDPPGTVRFGKNGVLCDEFAAKRLVPRGADARVRGAVWLPSGSRVGFVPGSYRHVRGRRAV